MGITFRGPNPKKTNDQGGGIISGATLCYTILQEAKLKNKSKIEKEFSVAAVVDKATSRKFKKAFPQNVVKEYENHEFEEKFKIAAPFPEQDDQYILNIKTNATMSKANTSQGLAKGDLIPYAWDIRPKALLPVEGGVKDITMSTLIGNGSIGQVAFRVMKNDYGTFPHLEAVLVEDLVEYIPESAANETAFGSLVGGLVEPDEPEPEEEEEMDTPFGNTVEPEGEDGKDGEEPDKEEVDEEDGEEEPVKEAPAKKAAVKKTTAKKAPVKKAAAKKKPEPEPEEDEEEDLDWDDDIPF